MSLFGDDHNDVPTRAKQSSSLFDDDVYNNNSNDNNNNNNNNNANPATTRGGNSLFADELDGVDSPWAFPSSKKADRAHVVRTLLPARDVPDAYVDAYEALLDAGDRAGSRGANVSLEGVRKMMQGGGVAGDVQARILDIVKLPEHESEGLGRPEFNVVLALMGLAGEGDDVTLDGVDERKRNLPVPSLSLSRPAKQPTPPPQEMPPQTPPVQPQPQPQQQTPARDTPSPGRSRATLRKQSFGDPEADPWGSPDLHRGHNHASYTAVPPHTNGAALSSATRTTSQFTTQTSVSTSAPEPIQPSSLGSEGGWGGYNGASNPPFAQSGLGDGGFGAPAARETPNVTSDMGRFIGRGNSGGATVDETITVTALSEKEGMFMFQHRNYELVSSRRPATKVVRRYSDFVWLLDCLHKRYPFRQLPLLPPKRVAINGTPIASDAGFLEKRRRGLVRFANALVRHPVFREEQLVVMFLTVPTELAVWRKQANLSTQEEFTGKPLPPDLEDSLPKTLTETFDTVRSGVRRSAETYIHLCNMMERLTRRNEGMAAEYLRFSTALTSLTESSLDTYAVDTNDVPLLNEGLIATARHLDQSRQLLEDEARGWEQGVLEDFKTQRDTLVSLRDMFDRRDKYAKDNIPALERRIANNEAKLQGIRNKPAEAVKPGEAEKVEDAIFKDKSSIVAQHARGVFIKECIRDELIFFHKSQYQVSKLHQEWAQERVKYAELQADCWRALVEEVEGMPGAE